MAGILHFIKTYWLIFSLVILAAITVLSLLPLVALPPAPGSDKTHHFISYALLALPVSLRKPRGWLLFCLFFIAYSGIIELVQPFVNRYCDLFDLLANLSGVACGAIAGGMVNIIFPVYEPGR